MYVFLPTLAGLLLFALQLLLAVTLLQGFPHLRMCALDTILCIQKTQKHHVNHLLDLLLIGLLLGALQLLHDEVGEVSSLRQQLRVAPALRNLDAVKHANTIKSNTNKG